MNKILVSIALGVAFVSAAAQAATVTYTGSYSGLTDVTNQLIQVQQFDSSLGALQGVTISLDATMRTQLQVNNDGNFYAGWDLTTYNFSLIGDSAYNSIAIANDGSNQRVVGSGSAGSNFTISSMQNITATNADNHLQSPGFYVWTKTGPVLTASQTFNVGVQSYFQGTGALNFYLTTLNDGGFSVAGTQTGGVPTNLQSLSTNIVGDVSVTYTYSAVPLPAAIWLLGSALTGLGWIRRRRD